MLVTISAVYYETPVSGLQLCGYAIALGGLIYYKLGGDKIREYAQHGNRQWAEFGATSPAKRRLVIIGTTVVLVLVLLFQMGSDPRGYVHGIIPDTTPGDAAPQPQV